MNYIQNTLDCKISSMYASICELQAREFFRAFGVCLFIASAEYADGEL